jgi:hypothetical protein
MKTVKIFKLEGCVPCEQLEEALENIERYQDNIDILDAGEYGDEYDIKQCPTVIFLLDGKEQKRATGYNYNSVINIVDWLYNS